MLCIRTKRHSRNSDEKDRHRVLIVSEAEPRHSYVWRTTDELRVGDLIESLGAVVGVERVTTEAV